MAKLKTILIGLLTFLSLGYSQQYKLEFNKGVYGAAGRDFFFNVPRYTKVFPDGRREAYYPEYHYRVKEGDTVSKILKKRFKGRDYIIAYQLARQNNPEIAKRNPYLDIIYPGDELKLPTSVDVFNNRNNNDIYQKGLSAIIEDSLHF